MNETNTPKEKRNALKRPRRYYDAQFKKAAVEHGERHGGDLSGTSAELGVNYWTLRDWVEAARGKTAGPATPRTVLELESEVRRLKSELARVTEQREPSGARSPKGAAPFARRAAPAGAGKS